MIEPKIVTNGDYAAAYASIGWPVFPIKPKDKRPLTENGLSDATTDQDKIHEWWRRWPSANIAVATGRIGWVLDIDPRHGGIESFDLLAARFGDLPSTLISKTGGGGTHWWFAPHSAAKNTAGRLGAGIDTRGFGGYVLVEPSKTSGAYSFFDFDPLSDPPPVLAEAPRWLIDLAFQKKPVAVPSEIAQQFTEGGRNVMLASLGGTMRRKGMSVEAINAALQTENSLRCAPPLDQSEVFAIAKSVSRYAAEDPVNVEGADSAHAAAKQINWRALHGDPPRRKWIINHWLGVGHPTLFVGPGGIGKTLFAQQAGSCLSICNNVLDEVESPVKCLFWGCEDDHDEFWRRQVAISHWLKRPLQDFENLIIYPRIGLDNVLLSTEFGRPMWAPLIGELEQQVSDLDVDVVFLDNIGQLFGGNENARHDVTVFLNGITGACCKRKPTAIVLLGHPSRAAGSEFSGNGAWENAVRMRWWLSDRLPDEKAEESTETSDTVRYLSKRKTNYSAKDYRIFDFDRGVLIPQEVAAVDDGMRAMQARRTVVHGVEALAKMGVYGSDTYSQNYLPALLVKYDLAGGLPKGMLCKAMSQLMVEGTLKRAVVGKNAARMPRYGLILG